MPATQTAAAKTALPDVSVLAANFAETQERNTATFLRVCDTVSKTMQEIWDNEPELFRLESDQMLQTLKPAEAATPAAALLAQCEQLHQNADRMVARMRHINDLAWNCGWRVATIYAEVLQDMWKQPETAAPAPAPAGKAKAA